MPLVVVLHGTRAPGLEAIQRVAEARSRRTTGFGPCADRHGIAVAYPEAVGGAWADGRGVTRAEGHGVDDVAFLRAVARRCADQYGADADGMILAGISNGAFMAHRMALEASDSVVAFGAIAGGLPAALTESRPSHAVSALLINGTADRIVPIEGGHSRRRESGGEYRGRTLSLADTARHWAEIDRCAVGEFVEERPAGSDPTHMAVTRRVMGSGAGGSRVEAWTVHGMGHTWPGTPVPAFLEKRLGRSPRNVDAAEEICRFALPVLATAQDRRL